MKYLSSFSLPVHYIIHLSPTSVRDVEVKVERCSRALPGMTTDDRIDGAQQYTTKLNENVIRNFSWRNPGVDGVVRYPEDRTSYVLWSSAVDVAASGESNISC